MRKKRESDRFLSFFSKVEQRPVITYAASVDAAGAECGAGPALPFELKEGMRVAPIQRRPALSPHTYDHLLDNDESTSRNSLYLSNVPRRRTTSPKRNEMRAKLFQFHDNYRPPYYGTWRKRSKTITGRRPFGRDTKILDYDVDSDEEWEDEPEGEEIGDENNQSDESEASDKYRCC
ncbi:unnamed protein product [Anisakis simplex]|uniref:Chromatin assembly factor 1 subunit A dimerization domain-containing protein n=1 Tax=Anisakis simplex TaxID=6269 RepID=A0A3P6N518_ANISI|nr:unnamed protein product [Anisakis simplex]